MIVGAMTDNLPAMVLAISVLLLAVLLIFAPSPRRILPRIPRWLLIIGMMLVLPWIIFTGIEGKDLPNTLGLALDLARQFEVISYITFAGLACTFLGIIGSITGHSRPNQKPIKEERRKANNVGKLIGKQSNKELVNALLRSSPNGMMVLRPIRDKENGLVDFECWLANPAAEQILGKPHSHLLSTPILELFPCVKTNGLFDLACSVIKTGLPMDEQREGVQGNIKSWYHINAVKHASGLAVTIADISVRKRLEHDLRHAARHDALTGLPNRALFKKRLEQAVHRTRRQSDYKFAVLFIDFDRFKEVNDRLGHDVGDELLKSIADRLRANLRAIDSVVSESGGHLPARLGGDEFVILLDGIQELHNAEIVAERLRLDLAEAHRIGGKLVTSTASIGIVTSDGEYSNADDVMRNADKAMYRAKVEGRSRCVVFDEKMHSAMATEVALEKELQQAVDSGAFILEYQPIVSLQSGRIAGFEALIRWPHPQRGIVLPDDFINLAVQLGLMKTIGRWVLRNACLALHDWSQKVPAALPLTMSVNISNQELLQPDLIEILTNTIKETNIEPSALRLDLSENLFTSWPEEIGEILSKLKDLGVTLAVDDFGAEHSSLNLLDSYGLDSLKIDGCFLTNYTKANNRSAMLRSIVDLAHNLKMSVVAEGVETEDQLSLLQKLGCDYGQGWIFSEPVSADKAVDLLSRDAGMRLAS